MKLVQGTDAQRVDATRLTAFRLFTLHLIVHGKSPFRKTAYHGHVCRALHWLHKRGFIAPVDCRTGDGATWTVTNAGKAAHDADPGLYL